MRDSLPHLVTPRASRINASIRALPLLCAGLLAGCQLPNVGPFVDATGQLKGAVASSGAAVGQELRLVPGAEGPAAALQKNWAARDRAMAAMLNYAESLDAIVAAGNSGAESAGKVADAIKGLAEAAGVAIPGSSEAVAVATDTAKFLYDQVAKIRAAKHLAEALAAAQPAVDKIAGLLREDFADLDRILQDVGPLSAAALANDPSTSLLQDQRKTILEALRKDRDLSKKPDRDDFAELLKLQADVDARYASYQAKLDATAARLRAAGQLIAAAGAALDAWSAAHAQLAVAARNHGTVSVGALIDATAELRDLVKRMRAL